MPKKQQELTQGRSIPKRLKHLEQGVSNWGKRWSKSPGRKNSTATSTGGEYNTFPVSGTTSDFPAGSPNGSQSSFALSDSTTLSRQATMSSFTSVGTYGSELQLPSWQYGQPSNSSRSRPINVPAIAITADPTYDHLRSSQDSNSPYASTPSPIPSSGPHTPLSMSAPLSPSNRGPLSSPNFTSVSPSNASARARRPSNATSNEYAGGIFVFEPDEDLQNPLLISGFTDVPWDRTAIGPTCSSSTTLPLTAFDSPTTTRRGSNASPTQAPMLQSNSDLDATFPMFVGNETYSAPAQQLLPPSNSTSATPSPTAQQSSLPSPTHFRSSYTPEYLTPPSAPQSQCSPSYQQFSPQPSYNGTNCISSIKQATSTQSAPLPYNYGEVTHTTQYSQPAAVTVPVGSSYTPVYIQAQAQTTVNPTTRAMNGTGAYVGNYQQGYSAPVADPRHSHTTYAYHPSYHPYRRP